MDEASANESGVASSEGRAPVKGNEEGPSSRPSVSGLQVAQTPEEQCVNETILHKMAEKLGRNWKALAIYLGITSSEVDAIVGDIPNDTVHQGFNMLVKWTQSQSLSVKDQMTKLCTALTDIKRVDIANMVQGIQTSALSGPDQLEICQDLLFTFYDQHKAFIPKFISSSMLPVLSIDDFYIPLQLLKSGQHVTRKDVRMKRTTRILNRPTTEPLHTWEEFYDEKGVGKKMILLSGGAGYGKSTILVKIVRTWKKGEGSTVGKFKLMFLLRLDKMATGCVLDAIYDQLLLRTDKLKKSDLKRVISDNEADIAFLLDGLDEIPSSALKSKEGEYPIGDLLGNKVLLKSCVLVTTRPHMVERVIKGFPDYARVETVGFTVKNRNKYIETHFPNDLTIARDLISWLDSNQSLQELSQCPIIARMLCLLWLNRPDASKPLPDKLTTVYKEFVEALIKRCHSASDTGENKSGVQQLMRTILEGLGEVSLQGLLEEDTVYFNPKDFAGRDVVLKNGRETGLLQKEKVASGLSDVEVVTFLHKSFQEYCAAYHLTSLLTKDGEQREGFRQNLQNIISVGVMKMQYVLRFCCGLSEEAAGLILSQMRRKGSDDVDQQSLARLLLFESGSTRLAFKLERPNWLSCWGQEQMAALHFYLESGIKPLKGTSFVIYCRSCVDVKMLGDIFRSCKSKLWTLIVECVLSDQGVDMLQTLEKVLRTADKVLLSRKLMCIKVKIFAESDYGAQNLLKCISHVPSQVWNICVSKRSPEDVYALLDALKDHALQSFSVDSVNMHGRVPALGLLVSSSLKSLGITDCELDDDDAKDLMGILPAGHGLTDLYLDDNVFSMDAVEALASHFQHLPELCDLSLDNVGNEDRVEQVLKQNIPQLEANATKASQWFPCSSYEDAEQLKQSFSTSGRVASSGWIVIYYIMSERGNEEMELFEKTLSTLDERLLGRLEFSLTVVEGSVYDVEQLTKFSCRLSSLVERFKLFMRERPAADVIRLLDSVTGECCLTNLEITGTNMQGNVIHLAPLIGPSLEKLKLAECGLNDDDVGYLKYILPAGQDGLEELDLSYNEFSLEAVRALTKHLRSFRYLTEVWLWSKCVDDAVVKQVIREFLPNLLA
ncbi:NACHT, LRR and PYD domains-containing protein 3-like [Acanthaster planci]|uniref:NACHT, LRR and PYD domains-containing protein 3-like n=1 Tax=Acanthaster planci TaxID=133434 RepID=A0A8B7YG82_ACAPL|nr:NACHT, LRR and PYD domains-containing protein 3-like [Acanthaster planci]